MCEDCVFCQIVAGAPPSSVVHESESLVVVMDVDPVTPGHLLVIPKAHLPELADLRDAIASEMFTVARSRLSPSRDLAPSTRW